MQKKNEGYSRPYVPFEFGNGEWDHTLSKSFNLSAYLKHWSGIVLNTTIRIPVADSFWYLAKLIQLCKV